VSQRSPLPLLLLLRLQLVMASGKKSLTRVLANHTTIIRFVRLMLPLSLRPKLKPIAVSLPNHHVSLPSPSGPSYLTVQATKQTRWDAPEVYTPAKERTGSTNAVDSGAAAAAASAAAAPAAQPAGS